jgi:elongation factor Tu
MPIIRGNALAALLSQGKDDETSRCIDELIEVMDSTIPVPHPLQDRPFLMAIESIFWIEGVGAVSVGRIERGTVRLGDEVEVLGLGKPVRQASVTRMEMSQKPLEEASAGDSLGILLHGLARADLERGQVLARPGSIAAHTKFEAVIHWMSTEAGGRRNPIFSGYRPLFCFRTTDVTGAVTLPEGVERCMPGDNVTITVQLIEDSPIAMDEGLRFAIREGGRTVGSGVVTRVLK